MFLSVAMMFGSCNSRMWKVMEYKKIPVVLCVRHVIAHVSCNVV